MKDETKVSIIAYVGIVAVLLAIAGAAVFLSTRSAAPAGCATLPLPLLPVFQEDRQTLLNEATALGIIPENARTLPGHLYVWNDGRIEMWIKITAQVTLYGEFKCFAAEEPHVAMFGEIGLRPNE